MVICLFLHCIVMLYGLQIFEYLRIFHSYFEDGDTVFPITGPWGHNPETHEFTEMQPTLL